MQDFDDPHDADPASAEHPLERTVIARVLACFPEPHARRLKEEGLRSIARGILAAKSLEADELALVAGLDPAQASRFAALDGVIAARVQRALRAVQLAAAEELHLPVPAPLPKVVVQRSAHRGSEDSGEALARLLHPQRFQ